MKLALQIFFRGRSNPDVSQLPAQPWFRNPDAKIGVAVAGAASVFLAFKQDLQNLPDACFPERTSGLFRNRLRFMRAAVFYCMRKLTGQAVSRGAGAAGVRKDMEFGKSAAAKKVQRRGVVFIRLPGKAGDEITRQSAAREVLPKERRPRQGGRSPR